MAERQKNPGIVNKEGEGRKRADQLAYMLGKMRVGKEGLA
jgi:hypothetical protein